jgi:hypothetical protein
VKTTYKVSCTSGRLLYVEAESAQEAFLIGFQKLVGAHYKPELHAYTAVIKAIEPAQAEESQACGLYDRGDS